MKREKEAELLSEFLKQLNKPNYGIRSHTNIVISCYVVAFALFIISGYVFERGSYIANLMLVFGGHFWGTGWVFHRSISQWKALAPHISTTSIDERMRELEL